ncbi:gag-pol polyprotein [Striga asiatica]|uniref:Gag-pol polyprotein n=1 Tax=Striga asiatica TaxID=4170 RepID=A0A5A7NX87_STRAF|nr:gag-pol polyprotein [Striga asiatica]
MYLHDGRCLQLIQVVTITCKYERLVNLCFYCGKVGHIKKGCGQRVDDIERQTLKEGQYGEWLRASEGLQGQGWKNSSSSSGHTKEPDFAPSNGHTQEEEIARCNTFSLRVAVTSAQKENHVQRVDTSSSQMGEGSFQGVEDSELVVFEVVHNHCHMEKIRKDTTEVDAMALD